MSQGLLGDPQSRAGINSPNRSFSASSGPSTPRSPGVTAFLREGSNWLYGGVFLSMFAGVIVLANEDERWLFARGDRLEEGLFLHDVLQQTKGVWYDLPIVEALLLHPPCF